MSTAEWRMKNRERTNKQVKERTDMKIKAIKEWEFRKKRGFK